MEKKIIFEKGDKVFYLKQINDTEYQPRLGEVADVGWDSDILTMVDGEEVSELLVFASKGEAREAAKIHSEFLRKLRDS